MNELRWRERLLERIPVSAGICPQQPQSVVAVMSRGPIKDDQQAISTAFVAPIDKVQDRVVWVAHGAAQSGDNAHSMLVDRQLLAGTDLQREFPGRAEHQRPQRPRVAARQGRHRHGILSVAEVEGCIYAAFCSTVAQQPRALVQQRLHDRDGKRQGLARSLHQGVACEMFIRLPSSELSI